MKFLRQVDFIEYVIAKLSEYVKISIQASSDSFYKRFCKSKIGPGTGFQATFHAEVLDKKFSFVILHKLAKFHFQTVFIFQIIQ